MRSGADGCQRIGCDLPALLADSFLYGWFQGSGELHYIDNKGFPVF